MKVRAEPGVDLLWQTEPSAGRRVAPTNSFLRFEKEWVEQSVAECFEQQVDRYPEHLAVKAGTCELTYRALNQAANRVARAILRERGHLRQF